MPESIVPFSARHRGQHRQVDSDFPKSARVGLLHVLCDLVDTDYVSDWKRIARELQRIGRLSPVEYSTASASLPRARSDAESALMNLAWERVFDFCERLHSRLAKECGYWDEDRDWVVSTSRVDVQAYIAGELRRLFLEEGLAFEFSDGIVRRRGRKHTVDVAARAEVVLGDPRLGSARKHFDKAWQFFKHPSRPDFENAVKEGVCCVEAAGKALFPQAKAATLGDLSKWLVASKDVRMPKALGQTITATYAYRSGGDGVGHGGADGGAATAEVAEYVLALCASQVIYLVDLASAQEPDVPF
jgi:hypothetical protein